MDLKGLLIETSKKIADIAANNILHDTSRLPLLISLIRNDDPKTAMRAAWVLSMIAEKAPCLVEPYKKELISSLQKCKNDSIRKCILKTFTFINLNEDTEQMGLITDICFDYLTDRKSIAVKIYAMEILHGISLFIPDIQYELSAILEELTYNNSPAIKNRSRKILELISDKE